MNLINEYETTYVVRPDLTDDQMTKIQTKIEGVIADQGGTVLVCEDWGKRKLAYLIDRHNKGHYVYLGYCGPSTVVGEVERNLRNDDTLLRFLTVRLGADVVAEERRILAEDRRRQRVERMAALKAEEEAEARYRAEAEEEEADLGTELDE